MIWGFSSPHSRRGHMCNTRYFKIKTIGPYFIEFFHLIVLEEEYRGNEDKLALVVVFISSTFVQKFFFFSFVGGLCDAIAAFASLHDVLGVLFPSLTSAFLASLEKFGAECVLNVVDDGRIGRLLSKTIITLH